MNTDKHGSRMNGDQREYLDKKRKWDAPFSFLL